MKPLPFEILDAVAGYLSLGMAGQAAGILDALPWELQTHPQVRAARVEVHLTGGEWSEAASVAAELTDFMSEEPQFWIWWAHATRRAEAVEAAGHHPDTAIIHYKLACHAAVSGRLDEARQRLEHALRLKPGLHLLAASEPDLQALGGAGYPAS